MKKLAIALAAVTALGLATPVAAQSVYIEGPGYAADFGPGYYRWGHRYHHWWGHPYRYGYYRHHHWGYGYDWD
jgi:hypothetical protein